MTMRTYATRAARAASELKFEMEFINDLIDEAKSDYDPGYNIEYSRLKNDKTFNNESKEFMTNVLYQHYKIMKQHINSYMNIIFMLFSCQCF